MDDEQIGTSRRPASRALPGTIVTGLILVTAALALGLAGWGWWLDRREPLDVIARTVKVLILSDIYEDPGARAEADPILKIARAMGVLAYVLVGLRLLLIDYGKAFAEFLYRRAARRHHVIVGMGPAAIEYAANHHHLFPKARAIHLADEAALSPVTSARSPAVEVFPGSSAKPSRRAPAVSWSTKAMTPIPGKPRRPSPATCPTWKCSPTSRTHGCATASAASIPISGYPLSPTPVALPARSCWRTRPFSSPRNWAHPFNTS